MTATDTLPAIGHARVLERTDTLDRPAWLDLRKRGLGGSDVAAICGQDRWRSPFQVYLEKIDAPLPDDDLSEAAEWGTILEPIVREVAATRTSLTIEPAPYLLQHPEHDHVLANIDGLGLRPVDVDADEIFVYEGKTAGVWTADGWGDDKNPEVPPAYALQGMHYLAVTGLGRALFAVLIGGQRLALRWVDRDQELIDHLMVLEHDFWERVVNRVPPPPDGSKACTELLAHLYDVNPGSVLTVEPGEVLPFLQARADAKALEKDAKAQADAAQNELIVRLGEHEVCQDPGGRVLFTRKEIPASDIAATTRSAYRRFAVPKGVLS